MNKKDLWSKKLSILRRVQEEKSRIADKSKTTCLMVKGCSLDEIKEYLTTGFIPVEHTDFENVGFLDIGKIVSKEKPYALAYFMDKIGFMADTFVRRYMGKYCFPFS